MVAVNTRKRAGTFVARSYSGFENPLAFPNSWCPAIREVDAATRTCCPWYERSAFARRRAVIVTDPVEVIGNAPAVTTGPAVCQPERMNRRIEFAEVRRKQIGR